MANRQPDTLEQPVIVPHLVQTGVVQSVGQSDCAVSMDHESTVESLEKSKVFSLKWHVREESGSNFLYIARAWKGLLGARYVRLQKHHVYRGRIGRRIIILEKKNGKIVRES